MDNFFVVNLRLFIGLPQFFDFLSGCLKGPRSDQLAGPARLVNRGVAPLLTLQFCDLLAQRGRLRISLVSLHLSTPQLLTQSINIESKSV